MDMVSGLSSLTALQVNSEPKIEKSSLIESTQEPSDIKDGMPPLNANNLAFHAWSHSKSSSQPSIETVLVVFEPRTLEVKDRVSDVSRV